MEGSEADDAGQDLYVCRSSCRSRCQFCDENQTQEKILGTVLVIESLETLNGPRSPGDVLVVMDDQLLAMCDCCPLLPSNSIALLPSPSVVLQRNLCNYRIRGSSSRK